MMNTARSTLNAFFCLFALAVTQAVEAQPFVYVANADSDTVSVIDTATNNLVATVAVGQTPIAVAISPDGARVWVANVDSFYISVFDTLTNTLVTDNTVGPYVDVAQPVGVVFTPDGTRAYVISAGSDDVYVMDTGGLLVGNIVKGDPIIPVGCDPVSIAITPDGTRVYVVNRSSRDISVIDTATNTVIDTVSLGAGSFPNTIAITPDGSGAYVTDIVEAKVFVLDLATHSVVGDPIPVGPGPYALAITPDGTQVYVPTGDPVGYGSSFVSVIDTTSSTVVATIPLTGYVRGTGIAFTPDGAHAYVTNCFASGDVWVIDTATRLPAGEPIDVGYCPTDIAVTPANPTPEDLLEELIENVEGLFAAESLNKGQANSLLKKLEKIQVKLEGEEIFIAINQLGALNNQVLSLVDEGILTPAEGLALVETIEALMDQLEN